jgi:murein DD-endopeptidase MepM/ murein hydrolase activator NlpD
MNNSLIQEILDSIYNERLVVIAKAVPVAHYCLIDLSIVNETLKKVAVSSSEKLGVFIDNCISDKESKIGFGGYLEKRNIYKRSDYFNNHTQPKDERNIHLGIDFWTEEGTSVHALLDGEIHSFQNNPNFGDYGPTIILEHKIGERTFYSLYGHLSLASIEGICIKDKVKKGEVIAQLGGAEVNGDYPPHLHFQLIIDLQN